MRKAVFRKKIEGRLVVNKIIDEFLNDAVILVGLNTIGMIERYFHTYRLQVKMSS